MFTKSKLKRRALGVLAPLACLTLFAQCDDVLETRPFGSLTTDNFLRTADDFEAATIGAYSTFQNLTFSGRDQSLFRAALLPSDDAAPPGNNDENDFAWTSTIGSFNYIWDVSYRGIFRANLILEALENTDLLTDAERARFAGEAKFVRAYFYFQLAQFYGTPPVITAPAQTPEETRVGNSAPGEVWDLIESDLEDAITGLAGLDLEAGRATEGAAKSLLGKVELFRAQWGQGLPAVLDVSPEQKYQEAITHLQDVVNSGQYSLVEYADNFRLTSENNPESIFELQASFGTDINGWAAADENGGGASSGTGRPLATGAGGFNGVVSPGGWDWGAGGILVTPTLVNEFERYDSMVVEVPLADEPTMVVIRDPRAYFTFYSTGQGYGRACDSGLAGTPVPYNYIWQCVDGDLETDGVARWSPTGHTPAKYIRPFENFAGGQSLNQSVSKNNERILRYADVLLMLAEAKILSGGSMAEAAALINQVRARARDAWNEAYGAQSDDAELYSAFSKPANLLLDVMPASQDQMFDALRHERRVELALELHRYEDLVRWLRAGLIQPSDIDWGDAVANRGFNVSTHLLRPIPQGELDLNPNLTQNPGYGGS